MKAYPTQGYEGDRYGGMDLRDYFASKATEKDIAPFLWEVVGYGISRQCCSREDAKYKYADAMMEARKPK